MDYISDSTNLVNLAGCQIESIINYNPIEKEDVTMTIL